MHDGQPRYRAGSSPRATLVRDQRHRCGTRDSVGAELITVSRQARRAAATVRLINRIRGRTRLRDGQNGRASWHYQALCIESFQFHRRRTLPDLGVRRGLEGQLSIAGPRRQHDLEIGLVAADAPLATGTSCHSRLRGLRRVGQRDSRGI